jgi:hypothetical protein
MRLSTVFRVCRIHWIALTLLLGSVPQAATAAPAALVITSPRNGAIVTSGQPLAITVTIDPGALVHGIVIWAQYPLGATGIETATGPTTHFTLTIPSNTPPGQYAIRALSVDSPSLVSDPVNVIVERADLPTDLTIGLPGIIFGYVGQTLPLIIFAKFPNGMSTDVTQSTLLIIESENSKVAIVEHGMAMAMGSGETVIRARYGSIAKTISVSVPVYIRGDLNGDGKVDQSDLNVVLAAKGWAANGTNDARDLNHDGIINELDAEIVRGLCTHPGCASQ